VHVVRELNQVLKARRRLEAARSHLGNAGDRPVSAEQVASAIGRPRGEVETLLRLAEVPTSLDAPRDALRDGEPAGESLLDGVADDAALDALGHALHHEVEQMLENHLSSLSHREREVLTDRFGLHDREPQTLEALAERMGLTRERIRQIQQEALAKLKQQMARHGVGRDSVF
jgi:RNA polymerase nonessential primary-like sigma factor